MTSDDKLLERYSRTNDAAAFAELTRRYGGMVLSTAQRVTGDRHDAEDVAQSCFLELAKRASDVRTSVAAYLHTSAARRAFNVIRDRSRRRHHEREAATGPDAAQSDTARERSWAELSPEIDAAIEQLPEDQRLPIILCYLRGLTIEQAAHELRVRRTAVDSRLKVAIRRLRSTLSTSGTVPAGVIVAGLRDSTARAMPATLQADCGRMALAGLGQPAPVPMTPWRLVPKRPVRWAAAAVVAVGLLAGSYSIRVGLSAPHVAVYERIHGFYGQRLGNGFEQRVAAMKRDEMLFWRGSQPLFFAWVAQAEPQWFANADHRVLCLASPRLTDAARLPARADAANSASLPFEVELLQGMIAARVRAGTRGDPARFDTDRRLSAAYRASLLASAPSPQSPSVLDDTELSRYSEDGVTLRRILRGHGDGIAALMTPVGSLPSVEAALREALENNTALANTVGARHVVRTASRVQRMNSAASQGMTTVIVLVDVGGTSRLVELQEIGPAASELANATPTDARPAGQRAAEDTVRLTQGAAVASWCTLDGRSMLVRVHIPTADDAEIEPTVEEWATAIAATHRTQLRRIVLASAMTPELLEKLSRLADDYLVVLDADFGEFRQDVRAQADQSAVEQQFSRELSAEHKSKKGKHQ